MAPTATAARMLQLPRGVDPESIALPYADMETASGTSGAAAIDTAAGAAVLRPTEQMASSMIGALLTSLLVTPFDVVKTRLQREAFPLPSDELKCGRCDRRIYLLKNGLMEHVLCEKVGLEAGNCKPARFTGTADAFAKIWTNEGPAALWRGLGPTLLMAVPQTVIYFTAYDQLKARLGPDRPDLAPLVAGPVARTFAVTLISPIEMIRTKVQAEAVARSARGYSSLVADAVRTEGVLSLWRGLGATLLRDVPFSAIYWVGYERLKPRIAEWLWGNPISPTAAPAPASAEWQAAFTASFLAGASSGTAAAALTLPFDVVKTRQQTAVGQAIIGARPACGGVGAVFREILRSQGVGGLFVGLTPRIAKVAPACAIMISTFEAGKGYFARRRHAAELAHIRGTFL
eukprot:m.385793 g.385793  ORF g.385793 m.385793 type:complete len:403 (-) comp16742_c1_seq24:1362-2570(-)